MIKLIIFDFDGVIVDSERLHFAKFRDVLAEWGEPFTWDEYRGKYLALCDRDCFETVLRDRGWDTSWTTGDPAGRRSLTPDILNGMCLRKEELFRKDVITGLKPVPGTIGFIRRAAAYHALAIASGSLHSEVAEALANLVVTEFFDVIVGADDVARGKPNPDPFLKAMELTGKMRGTTFAPQECVVVEDSIVGVEAATAAGMRCIALTTSYPAEKFERADIVTGTLENVEPPLSFGRD